MKCSDCFFCEAKQEYFFCNSNNLEVFNPENAGCSYGKKSLTLIVGDMNKKIMHHTGDAPISDIGYPPPPPSVSVMGRITIMLPHELKAKAVKRANMMGISLSRYIRNTLANTLDNHSAEYSIDAPVFHGKTP